MFRFNLVCCAFIFAFAISPGSTLLADEPQEDDKTRLAKGVEAWHQTREKCQGNYSYTVRWSSAFGFGHVTEIVVRNNKVFERRYESFSDRPQIDEPNQAVKEPEGERWVEKGEALGSHKQGAPPKTLDELYADAEKIAAKVLDPHERRYLRFDKQGLPISCFYIDTRIADDAPATGMNITSIQIAAESKNGEELARETVTSFVNALEKEDQAALGNILGVPFFDGGKQLLTDKSDVTKWYTSQLAEKDFSGITSEIGEVIAFNDIRDKLDGETGELMLKVLTEGDQLVSLTIIFANGKKEKLLALVSMKETPAKIVGFRDLR